MKKIILSTMIAFLATSTFAAETVVEKTETPTAASQPTKQHKKLHLKDTHKKEKHKEKTQTKTDTASPAVVK